MDLWEILPMNQSWKVHVNIQKQKWSAPNVFEKSVHGVEWASLRL